MSMSPCTKNASNILALACLKEKCEKFDYLSCTLESADCKTMPVGFLTPAEFYKSLLASAVFQQQQQQQQKFSRQQQNIKNASHCARTSRRCLLIPTQSEEINPKESTNTKSAEDIKPWQTNVAATEAISNESNNHNNHNTSSLLSPAVTNTPTPPDSAQLNLSENFEVHRKATPITSPIPIAKEREEQVSNSNKSNNSKSELLSHGFLQQCSPSNMPIGGVQSQNPTQGLVHWMSVMAEHMNVQSHHDPTPVGMHAYMWNGNVDVSKTLYA